MDIARALQEVKSLPTESLQEASRYGIPEWMALSELNDRARMPSKRPTPTTVREELTRYGLAPQPVETPMPPQRFSSGGIVPVNSPFVSSLLEGLYHPGLIDYDPSLMMAALKTAEGQADLEEPQNLRSPPDAPSLQRATGLPSLVPPIKVNNGGLINMSNGGYVGGYDILNPQQRALVNTIYGPESAGRYNVMYGGRRFNDYSWHPGQYHKITSGPNTGQETSAAGAGQWLESTWNSVANQYNLPDFSPRSQDMATWFHANDVYRRQTGGNLMEVLNSGDPQKIAGVGRALSGTWTSLPGGIEQGIGQNAFVNSYLGNMGSPGLPAGYDLGGMSPEMMTQAMMAGMQPPPEKNKGMGLMNLLMNQDQPPPPKPIVVDTSMDNRPDELDEEDPYMMALATAHTPPLVGGRKREMVA